MRPEKRNLPIRCVIYDCDGVLFDSLENNERFYNQVCTALGRGPVRPEELAYLHMHTVHESLSFLFPGEPDLDRKSVV